ncbi:hypothetical protein ESA94_13455 [Lacibacter luteus]|uniref:Uncharacterized protein n=1 Tax=Lacibacter luteus TaxID=2508719 RepID=A0A4Q1CI42_9BACT|nr:hypothetical protein [Lacibacter luteus]RXK60048.1 hypothetical protein ESA94_13455 [Lacibacter luteus]
MSLVIKMFLATPDTKGSKLEEFRKKVIARVLETQHHMREGNLKVFFIGCLQPQDPGDFNILIEVYSPDNKKLVAVEETLDALIEITYERFEVFCQATVFHNVSKSYTDSLE